MRCTKVELGAGQFAIVCGRGHRAPATCTWCRKPSTKLCDGKRNDRTCDRPMCSTHVAFTQGATDFCKDCSPNKAVQQRLPEAQW